MSLTSGIRSARRLYHRSFVTDPKKIRPSVKVFASCSRFSLCDGRSNRTETNKNDAKRKQNAVDLTVHERAGISEVTLSYLFATLR
jgi:hypothetical protein